MRLRLAIGAGLGVLALVAGCAAVAWPHGSKLVPRHGGHPVGQELWSWLFLGFACAAFLLYVAALGLLTAHAAGLGRRRAPKAFRARHHAETGREGRVLPDPPGLLRRGDTLRLVVALALAIQLAPLAAPLLISTDAWTYWDYGRIAAVHGANPYVQNPDDFQLDPAFVHVGTGWWDTSSVYGPAFTLASEPLALADGASAPAAAWTYKAIAAACMAAIVLLVARLTASPLAVAFSGWNPVLALHMAGGGHNDAWMAALVVAALAAAASGRRQLAGAAWALAILVKWVPLLFLGLRAVEARATRRAAGHAAFAGVAAAVVALATWRYGWHWLGAFGPLARNANHESRFALPHRLGGRPAAWAFAAAFALAYLWLLREAWRGRARLGLCAGLLLVATPWLVPWYAVWAVPLAALDENDRPAQVLALGFSGYLLRQAIPL